MAAITGVKGSITLMSGIGSGTDQAGLLNRWAVTATREIFDSTGFVTDNTNAREKMAGMYEWSWSAEGWLDASIAFSLSRFTTEEQAPATLTLAVSATRNFSGTAIVETCEIVAEKRGMCQVRLTGQGSGVLTPA